MVDILLVVLIAVAAIIILGYSFTHRRKKVLVSKGSMSEVDKKVLEDYVPFYDALSKPDRLIFESRMQHFLATTRIDGVNVTVERLDELLIAASAIIPIFSFPEWEYINLNEVMLYPDSFDEKFNQQGDERTTLGVVGDGPYQNVMILSQHELRQGFLNKTAKTNTAIHEFVHLIDKTDGAVDGVPESLISKQYVMPWLKLIERNIRLIKQNKSDINPYGATDKTEFLAVAAEYFFERPDLLKKKHPELYSLLNTMFRVKG